MLRLALRDRDSAVHNKTPYETDMSNTTIEKYTEYTYPKRTKNVCVVRYKAGK